MGLRFGTIIAMPNNYSQYGRVLDDNGLAYTIEPHNIPDGADEDTDLAYKVEIWENDSGLIHYAEED